MDAVGRLRRHRHRNQLFPFQPARGRRRAVGPYGCPAHDCFTSVLPFPSGFRPGGGSMKKLRRVTESEVIAEFLKNEFYQEEFHRDRDQFEGLVLEADISNDEENMLRRTLLFRRRGHMWRELP